MESAPTDAHESSTSGLHHRSPSISSGTGNTSPAGRQSKRTLSNAGAHHTHSSHHHCHSTHHARHHHHPDTHHDHILHHSHGQQHPLSDLESDELAHTCDLHHRSLAHAPSSPSLAPACHTSVQNHSHSGMMSSGQFASSSASAFHPAESVGTASQSSTSTSASASASSASSTTQGASTNASAAASATLIGGSHSINGADASDGTEGRECGKDHIFVDVSPSYSQPSPLVTLCRASGSSNAEYGSSGELQCGESDEGMQRASAAAQVEDLQNYNATSFGLPLLTRGEDEGTALSLYGPAASEVDAPCDEQRQSLRTNLKDSREGTTSKAILRVAAKFHIGDYSPLDALREESSPRGKVLQTPPTSPSRSPSYVSLKRQFRSRQWSRAHSSEQRPSRRIGWELATANAEVSGSPTLRGAKLPVAKEEERRRRKTSTPSQAQARDEDGCITVTSVTRLQKDFQLQPVPRSKRRKLLEKSGTSGGSILSLESNSPARCLSDKPPGDTSVETSSVGKAKAEESRVLTIQRGTNHEPASSCVATTSSIGCEPDVSKGSVTTHRRVLAPLDSTASACDRGTAPEQNRISGLAKGVGPSRCPAGSSRHRRGHLRRSQSLPNMRVRQDFDPSKPAKHRFIAPYHLSRSVISSRSALRPTGQASLVPHTGSRHKHAHHAGTITRPTVWSPPIMPPITRATLRELDLHEIVKNPQLRHDIVFDAHVQFRPNFDGERGRRKREACERYWTAVTREIETGCICTAFDGNRVLPCICSSGKVDPRTTPGTSSDADRGADTSRTGTMPSRLPTLILELRAICLSVLPHPANSPVTATAGSPWLGSSTAPVSGLSLPSGPGRAVRVPTTFFSGPATTSTSHYSVMAAGLDPALISQQLRHGVLNVSELVQFVASILKLHCAPMRDDLIEQMVTVTQRGQVGQGLRMCFEILELMKLDIANHQLRSTRPWLVNTAVEFEARWFRDQVNAGKIGTLHRTTTWIRQGWRDIDAPSNPEGLAASTLFTKAFKEAFMRLIVNPPLAGSVPSGTESTAETPRTATTPVASSLLNYAYSVAFPETFQFDAYRMITFHNEVVDISVMYMLLLLFRQLACSPAIASPGSTPVATRVAMVASKASGLAQRRLESVKAELSCLLNDAYASTPGLRSPTAASGVTMASTGFNKLRDPKWLGSLRPVLLQVAARAGAIWDEACQSPSATQPSEAASSHATSDALPAAMRVPNAKTIAMLDCWAAKQLSPDSVLMKMCISKLKDVLGSYITRKIGFQTRSHSQVKRPNGLAPESEQGSAPTSEPMLPVRKRASTESPDPLADCSSKRRKADDESPVSPRDERDSEEQDMDVAMSPSSSCASIAELSDRVIHPCGTPRKAKCSLAPVDGEQNITPSQASSLEQSPQAKAVPSIRVEADWDVLVAKAGLDSLKPELRSLGARLTQVATMNIKTFRSLYEVMIWPEPESPVAK